ncbi:MAG: ribonuclease HI [Desulfovibrionaceae bacterium]|nr:ribonuclease HI [Desulfovibrionaceae bacterium]
MKLTIYTDGSCLKNPGPGGWAAVILDNVAKTRTELSGGYQKTTNNRMEMTSVIEALNTLTEPCHIDLYSDSEYVCNAFNKGWLASWVKRNWVKSDRKPVKNVDLWQKMQEKIAPHQVTFHWVKGHAGNPENERCDQLAQNEARKKTLPIDVGFAKNS